VKGASGGATVLLLRWREGGHEALTLGEGLRRLNRPTHP
jgi:hypothetical protein